MSQVMLNKLVDVRVDSGQTLSVTHDAVLGGANVVRQAFRATTASASNMDFVIQTPGLGQFVSRRVDIVGQIPFSFQVNNYVPDTSVAPAVYVPPVLLPGLHVGVESYPMNSLITAATVQISTSSFTTQQQQIMPLLKRILRKKETRNKASITPSSLGATAIIYPTGLVPYPQGALAGTVGEEEDAFANASSKSRLVLNSFTIGPPTGGTGGVPVSPSVTTITGTLYIDEPLLCQPFKMDDETMAFINTNLIQVRLNLSSLNAELARIIRFSSRQYLPKQLIVDPGAPGSGIKPFPDIVFSNLAFDSARPNLMRDTFNLWTTFISPPGGAQVPPSTIYETVYYNPLPTAFTGAITAAGTIVESNTITLNTAPDLVAVYFVPGMPSTNEGLNVADDLAIPFAYPAGSAGLCREDALCNIVKLQVTWNNNPSLFATFDAQELYRRTVANGVAVPYGGGAVDDPNHRQELRVSTYNNLTAIPTYYPWAFPALVPASDPVAMGVGYPLLLALNKDIPVEPNVAAGVAGVFTLKVTATVRNTANHHTINAGGTLYVVPITSQYLKLNSGAMSDIIATVATEADVYRTPVVGDVQAKEMVGAGRTRVSADPHAVASSRRLVAPRSDSGDMGGAGSYIGTKRAHMQA